MKFVCLFAGLVCIALSVEAQIITVNPKPLPLTEKNIDHNRWRAAFCMAAVQEEESATKRIHVLGVYIEPTKDKFIAACDVSAEVVESTGAYSNTTTQVRYSGNLNLKTGKVEWTRIDKDAAK